ncbi:MAG: acetylpolyamine amidohydrolase AphA [Rhodospirillales bacterium]
MRVIYSEDHRLHDGGKELIGGELVPQFEKPSRMDMVLAALDARGFDDRVTPERIGLGPARRVHSDDYLDFLAVAWDRWTAEMPDQDFALAFTFGMRRLRQEPGRSIHQQLGWYAFDAAAPLVAGSWQAIQSSLDCAMTAQRLVAAGAQSAFALCRPPGHHAMRDMAGGYCYINNAAAAAQAFVDAGAARVAILDVDYHHGNGTQDIFYDSDRVLFVSLHGHPDQEYPYFAGHESETGAGAGAGFNHNYPLAWGTGWEGYGAALDDGLAKIAAYRPDALVVSLGVDTFEQDPISHFKLTSPDYLTLGAKIGGLGLPSLFVMEGGYAVEEIGINTVNLLQGYADRA